jgi:hypothetical protein
MADLTVTGFIDEFMDADEALLSISKIWRVTGTAAETVSVEDAIFYSDISGEFFKTDAGYLAGGNAGLLAFCLTDAVSGEVITGIGRGLYYSTGYLTGTYYLNTSSPGSLTDTAPTGVGQIVRAFGYTVYPSGLMVDPDITFFQVADSSSIPAHASNHTNGTDDIQDATSSQKGLMTSAYASKLDNATGFVTEYNGQTGAITGVESFNAQVGHLTGVESFNAQVGHLTGVESVNGKGGGVITLDTDEIPTGVNNRYLSQADYIDLTDAGDSTLHFHAYDRDLGLHTGDWLHASNHTDGTDDIQDATASVKGLMTTAYASKLDNATGFVTEYNGQTGAITGVESFNAQVGHLTGVESFNAQVGHLTGVESFNANVGHLTGVESVNGKGGGAITLDADEIPDTSTTSKFAVTGQLTKVDEHHNGIKANTGTTYTLVLADQGRFVEMNNASANTLTIPTNASVAFPTGTSLDIIQYGAGVTTVSGAGGVEINGFTPGGGTVSAQYGAVSLYKRGTDEWIAVGLVAGN